MPFTETMECACTEEWYPIPACAGETQQRYAYGFWVNQSCAVHTLHLEEMQQMIKEIRDEGQV